jgi:uncharacterized protein YkwD
MACRFSLVLPVILLVANISQADDLTSLDETFHKACPAGANIRLQRVVALDRAAEALASGARLDDALQDALYRQEVSMSATITGKAALRQRWQETAAVLFDRFCDDIVVDRLSDLGFHHDTDRLLLVLARPRQSIGPDDVPHMRARLLQLINEARAQPRHCGERAFSAAGALVYSNALTEASIRHALDMAKRGRMDHRGSDGSSPSERLTRVGYRWQHSGENLALGYDSVDELVQGWLASPTHCANIMDGRFVETGVSFAVGAEDGSLLYWAQSFAAPHGASFSRTASR